MSNATGVDGVLWCLIIISALLLAAFIRAVIQAPAQPATAPVQADPAPADAGPVPAPKLPIRKPAGARPPPPPPTPPAAPVIPGICPSMPFAAARRGDQHRGRPA